MALTKTVQRKWLEQLFDFQGQIDALKRQRTAVAEKLGSGTWRLETHPDQKLVIRDATTIDRTDWKAVACHIARTQKVDLDYYVRKNQSKIRRSTSVRIRTDHAKPQHQQASAL